MENLEKTAKGIRRDIVKMIGKAASGHPGGSLSAVEILSLLYFEKMPGKSAPLTYECQTAKTNQ